MATQVSVIRATLKYKTQEEMIRGMAPHISKRGLIIHTRQTREVGACIQFEFKLADGMRSYTGEGVVRQILDGTKPGMLIALKRVNHAFKEVVDAILSGAETTDTGAAFSQHIVNGGDAGNIFGDMDLDSGIDSLFSSIEKAPVDRKKEAINGLYSEKFDMSAPIETPSLSFEIGELRETASSVEGGEASVDEFERALNSLSGNGEKVSVGVKSEDDELRLKETERFFAVKREKKSELDASEEEVRSIQAQASKPSSSESSRSTTLTGFPIEEESSADLFAALQSEIFAMQSSDNSVIPESLLSESEKRTVLPPPNEPAAKSIIPSAPAPISGINPLKGSSRILSPEKAEIKPVSNPLLNRVSSPSPKPVSLEELISQTSVDALDKEDSKAASPKPVSRKANENNASLDALLKRADIKSKNVILTDVNTRKATPRKRNSSEDGEPAIPVPKKGGFLSNLFKK